MSIYRVNVTLSSDSLSLTDPSGNLSLPLLPCVLIACVTAPEVIVAERPAESLGSVAVDWINNELYWIENSTTESRVCGQPDNCSDYIIIAWGQPFNIIIVTYISVIYSY